MTARKGFVTYVLITGLCALLCVLSVDDACPGNGNASKGVPQGGGNGKKVMSQGYMPPGMQRIQALQRQAEKEGKSEKQLTKIAGKIVAGIKTVVERATMRVGKSLKNNALYWDSFMIFHRGPLAPSTQLALAQQRLDEIYDQTEGLSGPEIDLIRQGLTYCKEWLNDRYEEALQYYGRAMMILEKAKLKHIPRWLKNHSKRHYTTTADLNEDGTFDLEDILIVSRAFYTREGDETYNPVADLNQDGEVNEADIEMITASLGRRP